MKVLGSCQEPRARSDADSGRAITANRCERLGP
jgi:hypothetical protein